MFKFPWDTGNSTVKTRLVEDGDWYGVQFEDDNSTEHKYRHNKRTGHADAKFMGHKSEFRLVAHLSPGEQLKLYEETGVMPGVDRPEKVVWALNQSNYSLLRTIEGKIGRAVKD